MGAFFLYRTDTAVCMEAVEHLFTAKGFGTPHINVFGKWTLLRYQKQLLPHAQCSVFKQGTSLYSVGTVTYKGLGSREGLEALCADIQDGRLDHDMLAGAYCLLVCKDACVTLITDRMNLFHVFTNEEQTVFSSSFAAVLKAGPNKFRLNEQAIIENLVTGYIIGPDTVAKGVYLIGSRHPLPMKNVDLRLERPPKIKTSEPTRKATLAACVDEQLDVLDTYFSRFSKLVEEAGGVDIGLSGGYDSRVLLLMAKRHFANVYAHSHFHRMPTADETCAEKIAAVTGVPLYRCSGAKQPADMDIEEFERNLENTAVYNDGRVAHEYSWLLYFRTRWYREAVLRARRFGMDGLGGELYRNFDNHLYKTVNVREWAKLHVLGAGIASSMTDQALNRTLEYTLTKAGQVLETDFSKRITHHETRRYFGELFSVYGAAVR